MLHVYISYAPEDKACLDKLVEWLTPMQEDYFLRIWYNHPMPAPPRLPDIWQMLFFWYRPERPGLPYHPHLTYQTREGHIYLFLTSHHSLRVAHINQIEIPTAVDRYTELGQRFIRIFPVMVSPSHWKQHSSLSGFATLGPKKSIAETQPQEDAYLAIVEQLKPAIEELRRNWMEEFKRQGRSLEAFKHPPMLEEGRPVWKSLPRWTGWLILGLILYSVMNWYTDSCSPRYYKRLRDVLPPVFERPPEEFPRSEPYRSPLPVPLPPKDSLAPSLLDEVKPQKVRDAEEMLQSVDSMMKKVEKLDDGIEE